jgi:hypothetical protein
MTSIDVFNNFAFIEEGMKKLIIDTFAAIPRLSFEPIRNKVFVKSHNALFTREVSENNFLCLTCKYYGTCNSGGIIKLWISNPYPCDIYMSNPKFAVLLENKHFNGSEWNGGKNVWLDGVYFFDRFWQEQLQSMCQDINTFRKEYLIPTADIIAKFEIRCPLYRIRSAILTMLRSLDVHEFIPEEKLISMAKEKCVTNQSYNGYSFTDEKSQFTKLSFNLTPKKKEKLQYLITISKLFKVGDHGDPNNPGLMYIKCSFESKDIYIILCAYSQLNHVFDRMFECMLWNTYIFSDETTRIDKNGYLKFAISSSESVSDNGIITDETKEQFYDDCQYIMKHN